MAFQDIPLKAGKSGLTVSGLSLVKTAAMTLEVAAGSVKLHKSGVTYTLGSAQSHAFASDPSLPTKIFMGLVDNGGTTDLWVDAYVDDGAKAEADPPSGYTLIVALAWFTIPAAEIDLANATIRRRTWV